MWPIAFSITNQTRILTRKKVSEKSADNNISCFCFDLFKSKIFVEIVTSFIFSDFLWKESAFLKVYFGQNVKKN